MVKYISDVEYLNSFVKKAKKDNVNIRNLKILSVFFGLNFIYGNSNEGYFGPLDKIIIVLNKDYDDITKLIYGTYIIGHYLVYSKDNLCEVGRVFYDKDMVISEEYDKLYKDFAKDLLLDQHNLEKYINKNKGRGL